MTRFFTFYTRDTPYEQEAKELVWAFTTFNIEVRAEGYLNRKDWMKNALWRASALWVIANHNKKDNICMLDADVRPVKHPYKLVNFEGDFACEDRGEGIPSFRRFSAGVLCFGPSAFGRRLLYVWHRRCQEDKLPDMKLREQHYLYESIEELNESGLQLQNLGNAYNRKVEDVRPNDDTVIIHHVASRKYLDDIGGKR